MSGILIISIVIRLLAFFWAIYLIARVRDWRIVFLAGMIALMALRQSLTLLKGPDFWPISFAANVEELPGLVVSVLALISLVFLERIIHKDRKQSAELAAANAELQAKISQQEKAQIALRQSEARYRALYNQTPVMLHAIDMEGRLVNVSDYWLTALGYEREEVIGRPLADFLTPASCRYFEGQNFPAFLRDGQVQDVPYQYVRKDGGIVEALLSAVGERDEQGRFVRSRSVSIDVTEKKAAAEQLRQRHTELAQVLRMSTMGEMTSAIAHELNQPLTAIYNYARGCLRRVRSGKWSREELIDVMEKTSEQAKRASDVVRNIREFLGRGAPDRSHVDLNDLAMVVANLAASELHSGRVGLSLDLADAVPPVLADRIEIEQAILNLVRNGIDALQEVPEGERRLVMHTSTVDDRAVEVAVFDSGPGLSTAVVDRIFEPFFTTKQDGMGMGLAISRTIVEAHGGRIWAEANGGRGTTFRLRLPIEDKGVDGDR